VAEADGVIIATPEYNHSYSAVTKNLIDWASRPFMKGPIIGKKSMVIAVTPGPGGGVHAAQATTEVLSLLGGTVVAQVTAAAVHEKVDTATNTVTDADLVAQITQGLASF
jgi:chromate reductase